MIWRLFRAGEEKGGDETGTLIWTTLVMNFWLSWKKNHTHTHNKFLSFIRRSHLICLLPLGEEQRDQRFYMMFPACRTMLGWLQRNPCDGVRWELLEQCLGLSLVSALCRNTCHHTVLPKLYTGEFSCLYLLETDCAMPASSPAWFHLLWERDFSCQLRAFGSINCDMKVTFVSISLMF